MQTSVMLCAPLDTPACGISRDEEKLSFVDLSVLRGLGRSRVTLDDHLLMSVEAQYATTKLIEWLSVNEANLDLSIGVNPRRINFADIDVPPADFEESNTATQRFQFSRWSKLTLSRFFQALSKVRADHRLLVGIPAAVRRFLDGRHESIHS